MFNFHCEIFNFHYSKCLILDLIFIYVSHPALAFSERPGLRRGRALEAGGGRAPPVSRLPFPSVATKRRIPVPYTTLYP